jgi:4-coumarate--CoA ligase
LTASQWTSTDFFWYQRNNDECPRAYVVLKAGQQVSATDIVQFMDQRVARIKRLTGGVVFVDAIPKNPSGKILRKLLREKAQKEVLSDGVRAVL